MAEQQRAFKGVWIPAEIWLNKSLSLQEKAVLAEIDSFCSRYESCYASNEHFAKFIGVSTRRIQDIIKALEDKHLIEREVTYKQGTKEIEKRFLRVRYPSRRILHGGGEESFMGGGEENCAVNNTSINKTIDYNMRKSAKAEKDAKYEELFTIFYNAYPKKKDKTKAFNAFKKLKPTQELLDSILKALEWQKQTTDWQKQGGQYIPYPASYLNGHRWEDEQQVNIAAPDDDYDPDNRASLWVNG